MKCTKCGNITSKKVMACPICYAPESFLRKASGEEIQQAKEYEAAIMRKATAMREPTMREPAAAMHEATMREPAITHEAAMREPTMHAVIKNYADDRTGSIIAPEFWIKGLRIFAWIFCVAGVIGGFYGAYQLGMLFGDWDWHTGEEQMNGAIFFFSLLGSLVVTFIATAVMMIFLDMAQNISNIARDSAQISDIAQGSAEIKEKLLEMDAAKASGIDITV